MGDSINTIQELVDNLFFMPEFFPQIFRNGEEIISFSNYEFYERVVGISKGLIDFGLKSGNRVALIGDNSHNWFASSLAINYAGLIDVPRGTDSSKEELDYILNHSDSKIAIVDDSAVDKLSLDNNKIIKFSELNDFSKNGFKKNIHFEILKPEDTASIIYTSGTTGNPKGVELTHKNFLSNANATLNFLGDISNDKLLSVLPPWHVFGRMEKYVALMGGAEMFYTNPKNFPNDLVEQSPTIIVSVPRIWESVYDKITKNPKIRKFNSMKDGLIKKALKPIVYLKLKKVAKEKLGGQVRLIVSGGGGLPYKIDKFFDDINIEVLEGYGMTEASPVISARTPRSHALGTIGKPLKGVSVEIRDEDDNVLNANQEGMIYVKGPNVMKGYFKHPIETRKVLKGSWLETGDMCFIREDGNLVFTGRSKELIVLTGGENIHPNRLEDLLSTSPYITNAFVFGDYYDGSKNQSLAKIGALIAPDEDYLKEFCQENHVPVDYNHEVVKQLYKSEIIKLVNDRQPPQSRIYDFRFIEPFRVGFELTQSMKLKRNDIIRNYHRKTILEMIPKLRK